jgi:hypothetical protein
MVPTRRSLARLSPGVAFPGNQSTSTQQAADTTTSPRKDVKRKQPPDSQEPSKSKKANTTVTESSASAHAGETRGRPTCFRITAIPLDWGKEELKDKLAKMDPDLNLENVELTIFPVCSHFTKTQTALLRLDRNTAYFEGWKQSDEKRNTFKEQDKPTVRLNIDKHFYGLTPLNKPDEPITAEFVSLHILEHCLAR